MKRFITRAVLLTLLLAAIAAASAAPSESGFEINDEAATDATPRVPQHPAHAAMEALGRSLFFDRTLSASRKVSCSSCHDPRYAYGPPNSLSVQPGGKTLRAQGERAAPSLRYLQKVPVFTEHYFDEDFDESVDNGPTGGLTWDGRVRNPREQARIPLLSPLEMANENIEAVVKSATASHATELKQTFGPHVLDNAATAFAAIARSLEVFQQSAAEFFPYSSKYDASLRGETQLTDQEARGLAAFNDPGKGNCARCHQSAIGSSGAFPAFTDFGFIALGVPRNRTLPHNRDESYHDLGLCGPLRADLADHAEYCGLFRTPSLRNVTLKQSFFHNGGVHSLREAVTFYVERETHPENWYSKDSRGKVRSYDDLPPKYWENLNREPPFDRKPGDAPALTPAEIDDVAVFLGTLTDGWKQGH